MGTVAEGLAWQIGVWDQMAPVYIREIDRRFVPVQAESIDVVVACLSLTYVIDRAAAAREIARVLRLGGQLVAAVWAGPERADIVRLQQTAGSFAPEPPVPGVGPGALADPRPSWPNCRTRAWRRGSSPRSPSSSSTTSPRPGLSWPA